MEDHPRAPAPLLQEQSQW